MKVLILIVLFNSTSLMADYLFSDKSFTPNERWTTHSKSESENLKNLFRKLLKSKTGKELVKRAQSKAAKSDKKLLEIVKAGKGSLTDTTLIRKFSKGSPDLISYESQSSVYINSDLSQYDAVLDLAHELTHYVYRKNFNPYELNFTLAEFIKNTIEGRGGEVQAFLMECNVQKELFPSWQNNKYNCKRIRDDNNDSFSFKAAVEHFYQVGNYFESFDHTLKKHGIRNEFPRISGSTASFVSSAYGVPYPVAAFEEYLSVIEKVCQNDKRRLSYFKNAKGRSPASINQFEKKYQQKCLKNI